MFAKLPSPMRVSQNGHRGYFGFILFLFAVSPWQTAKSKAFCLAITTLIAIFANTLRSVYQPPCLCMTRARLSYRNGKAKG